MTNMNQILATVEDTKLNLRMLSASMYDTPLRIALDRPVYQYYQAFGRIRFSERDIFQAAGRHQYQSRVDGDYRDNGCDRIARFGCKIKYPSLRGVFYFNYHRPNVRINPR